MFVRTTKFLWLLSATAVFSTLCCNAQSLSLASFNPTSVDWTSGPADASLGKLADIKITKGYRFTDAAGASALLKRMNNPVPQGLVGILAPTSGQWWAILTYKNIGYVKGAAKDRIDAAAILKTISERAQRQNEDRTIHGLPAITSVDWEMPPVFDAKADTVEWAVLVKMPSGEVINHTMRLLGRRGVLDATVVEPYQSGGSTLAPLKDLMKNISFKPGQRYTDFQKGDTVADIGLAGLIAGNDDSIVAQKDAAVAATKSADIWSSWGWYGYVGVGVLAGGIALVLRRAVRRRNRKMRHARSASLAGNGNGSAEEPAQHAHATATLGNGHESGDLKPAEGEPADVKNGSHRRRSARRKKIFDYHRFYTDTVLKLSSGTVAYTEFSKSNGRVNGNGHVNGHSLDHDTDSQPPTYGDTNQALVQAHLDLIANQKELIEEQKRLMIQQAKLIEEKSRLIAEKSQLLDRQTELFERDLL